MKRACTSHLSVALIVWLARPDVVLGAPPLSEVDRATHILERHSNGKTRAQAASALGRTRDERAVRPLVHSLQKDRSAEVRRTAAQALAEIGDPDALVGLRRAERDVNLGVRKAAHEAIIRLGGRPVATTKGPRHSISLGVGKLGDRTRRARNQLLMRMGDYVRLELKATPGVTLVSPAHTGGNPQYTVEGSITELSRRMLPKWVQVTCGVSLVLSRGSGKIVGVSSTSATIEHPRSGYRQEQDAFLEERALQSAIRGAHQDLLPHFSRR